MAEKLLLDVEFATLPPTLNHVYRRSQRCMYKTKEGREWQSMASILLRRCAKLTEPFTGDVRTEYIFQASNRRAWDVDNRVKVVQDVLMMAGIIKDDSQIKKFSAERTQGKTETTRVIVYARIDEGGTADAGSKRSRTARKAD